MMSNSKRQEILQDDMWFQWLDLNKPQLGLNKDTYKVLLDTLKVLQKKHTSHSLGICGNWAILIDSKGLPRMLAYELVQYFGSDWTYSVYPREYRSYPVPWTLYKWKGEGLKLRKSLMSYIHKRLRDLHRRAKD